MCRKTFNQFGFTLIEIIVSLVIISIFSVMILTFLSTSLVRSSDSIRIIQNTSDINIVMAMIEADYNKYPKWRSGITYAENSFVVPMIRNGHYYKTTGVCTSGVNEPDWPMSGTILDGSCTWSETVDVAKGPLLTLNDLKINIDNKIYETTDLRYNVVYNNFIQFVSGTETGGGSKILKVTIKNNPCDPQTCATLTLLFVSN